MNPTREELIKVISETGNIHEVAKHFGVTWGTIRSWYRWKNINLMPSKEQLLEDCKNLLDKDIAQKYKVTEKSLTCWKRKYNISKKRNRSEMLSSPFTELQKNAINGMLLGDAWIEKCNKKNRSKNCNFGTEHCVEQLEYVLKIHEILSPFSLPVRFRSRQNPFCKNDNHKSTIHSCICNTKKCEHFTELREMWYPKGIKTIPKDIDLSWQTIAFWYCDDGSNEKGNRCIRRNGILCTNGFQVSDVELLIGKLQDKKIECNITYNYGQPIIKLKKNTFSQFIENIKKHISWNCFDHKLKLD